MEWIKDLNVEQRLISCCYVWQLKMLPIDSIDLPKSAANLARISPITTPVVDSYAAAMRAGDAFPAVVVARVSGSTLLAGGNHRTRAAMANKESFVYAYVIDGELSRHEFEVLCKSLNAINGHETPVSHRILQGAEMVQRGMKATDAAKTLAVSANAISAEVRAQDTETIALRLKVSIDGWPKTTRAAIATMKPIAMRDAIIRAGAGKKLSYDQIDGIRRQVEHAGSDDEAYSLISRWADSLQATSKRGVNASPRKLSFFSSATRISKTLSACRVFDDLQMTNDEAKKLCRELQASLTSIRSLMATGSQESEA